MSPGIHKIFADARELESSAERAAFLDKACAGDARLREEVQELLDLTIDAEFLGRVPL